MDNTEALLNAGSSGRQLFGQWGYYCETLENPFDMEVIRRLICLDMLPKATAVKIWVIEEMELGWN